MSTIVLAYPKLGYAANSTLTVGTDLDLTTALGLIGEGDARWGTGGPPTLDPSAFVPMTGLTGMTDGQIIAKSAALGGMIPVNPTGSSELAYAENISTSTQGATNTTVDVQGCVIAVPASQRPVYLWGSLVMQVTSAAGSLSIFLTEVSNGVDTPVTIQALGYAPATNADVTVNVPLTRLAGSTARTRTFKLQAKAGSQTFVIENGVSNRRSLIGAMAL